MTQRRKRRQTSFFEDDDYATYLARLVEHCRLRKSSVWAWRIMLNHVHIVSAPTTNVGLGKAIADTHRRYSWLMNRCSGWSGNLWPED